jgi:hypothetical protein
VWWLTPVIPDIQEAEIRRIIVQGQAWQKVIKTSSEQISQMWWYTPVIPAWWEAYL